MTKTTEKMTTQDKAKRELGREIGKTVWRMRFNNANPDATAEQKQESWKQHRAEHVKIGMNVVRNLEKSGYTISK